MNFLYFHISILSRTSILIILLGLLPDAIAQTSKHIDLDISNSKMKARALHASKMGDPYTALFYYEEIVKRDSSDIEMRFDLAELYQLTRNYPKAEKHFGYVCEKDLENNYIALYHMAIMQKMQGKYGEAKKNLLEFKKKAKNIGSKEIKMLLDKDIAGCDSGFIYSNFPEEIKVENAGKSINNPHAEFSPIFIEKDKILFGSLRMDSIKYYSIKEENTEQQPVRKIYKGEYVNNEWQEDGLAEEFKDNHTDIGDIVYSPFTDRFYFSKCTKSPNAKPSCKLYYSDKTKKQFLFHAPINTDGFNSTQPAIVYDSASKSEVLYYVTDRSTGGKGGMDIWYATYNIAKNKWSAPANFSATNTAGMEFSPYYHAPSKSFYFSSNGHAGAGGLDVFRLKKDGTKFSKPENVGFPVNSPQDDFDYCLDEKGTKGFVVSNRPGGTPYFHLTCCDDIFMFEPLPYKPFNKSLALNLKLDSTENPNDAKILVQKWNVKKNTRKTESLEATDIQNIPLEKNTSYKFIITKPGLKSDTVSIDYKEINGEANNFSKNIGAKRVAQTVVAVNQPTVSSTVKEKEAVKEKPIVAETNKATGPVEVEKEQTLATAPTKDITATAVATTTKTTQTKHHVAHKAPILDEKPTIEKAFTISDIQYESGITDLSDEGKHAIDSLLIPFLEKNITKKLMISSHTDNIGSHHYNMKVSEDRVKKVAEYLVSKNISSSRLITKGFGETRPVAQNENPDGSDDPIGRGLNRRTEFEIVK